MAVTAAGVVLALAVRIFVLAACRIHSSSMVPALLPGDRVLVNRMAYVLGPVRRGDVVAFRREGRLIVKRCTAGPGDSVRTIGSGFRLPAEGEQLWFLTGDNADSSYDSRMYGPVPASEIIGRVMLIFWSVNDEDPLSVRWSRIGTPVR